MERPQRKRLRLESYDYSQPGSYFITICTRERNQEVLGGSWMKHSERSRITTPAYR